MPVWYSVRNQRGIIMTTRSRLNQLEADLEQLSQIANARKLELNRNVARLAALKRLRLHQRAYQVARADIKRDLKRINKLYTEELCKSKEAWRVFFKARTEYFKSQQANIARNDLEMVRNLIDECKSQLPADKLKVFEKHVKIIV